MLPSPLRRSSRPLWREDALALVRQLVEAAASRDPARMASLYAEEAVTVSPVFGDVRGRDGIAASWTTLFSSSSTRTFQTARFTTSRALARVGELELATDAFARAIHSFFCVPGIGLGAARAVTGVDKPSGRAPRGPGSARPPSTLGIREIRRVASCRRANRYPRT
jgi:uncharacterized protein (TIGR02246 family)